MPTAVIIPSEVKPLTSGMKDGRAWTLYRVITQDGKEFGTFDAAWQQRIGQESPIDYVEEDVPGKDGKRYKRRTIVPPKKDAGKPPQETFSALYQFGQIEKRLASIEAKVDEVVNYCRNEPPQ